MLENSNVIRCLTVNMIAISAEYCISVTVTISGVISQMVKKCLASSQQNKVYFSSICLSSYFLRKFRINCKYAL